MFNIAEQDDCCSTLKLNDNTSRGRYVGGLPETLLRAAGGASRTPLEVFRGIVWDPMEVSRSTTSGLLKHILRNYLEYFWSTWKIAWGSFGHDISKRTIWVPFENT
jgi:hypothetical protein